MVFQVPPYVVLNGGETVRTISPPLCFLTVVSPIMRNEPLGPGVDGSTEAVTGGAPLVSPPGGAGEVALPAGPTD